MTRAHPHLTRLPGAEPYSRDGVVVYGFNPYKTKQRLFRFVVAGANRFGDPEYRRVWAPDGYAALLVARQYLTQTRLEPGTERTVDPPGLP